ncbi:MAG: DeoR/GlpR transcriptional regulator [Rhodospirillales bacterium]|jgi:DeoR/GlpR family transcriptional regulator of sugar metabolism|nr:DeoR/GlpR transcriptional regulator [Rhodospirillales bacterium]
MSESKKAKRREQLIAEITKDPGILMRDLALRFDVSRETIRRDFDALRDDGRLQRRYGGAAFLPKGNPLSFEARQDKFLRERRAIVRCAHNLIEDEMTLMLGPGTTALLFAEELVSTSKRLTVITNGVQEALTLSKSDNIRVVLAPGEVDRLEGFAWGHETTDFVSKFKSDMAIFCADGLAVSGVSEADSRTVWTVRTMIDRSTQKMLLIDHFRFNETGLEQICLLSDLDMVISDQEPDTSLLDALKENNVAFHSA